MFVGGFEPKPILGFCKSQFSVNPVVLMLSTREINKQHSKGTAHDVMLVRVLYSSAYIISDGAM